jgi:hypothetical protein
MPDREASIDAVVFDLINFIKSKYLSQGQISGHPTLAQQHSSSP